MGIRTTKRMENSRYFIVLFVSALYTRINIILLYTSLHYCLNTRPLIPVYPAGTLTMRNLLRAHLNRYQDPRMSAKVPTIPAPMNPDWSFACSCVSTLRTVRQGHSAPSPRLSTNCPLDHHLADLQQRSGTENTALQSDP